MENKKKINLITLGCSKNRVDSEHILRQLDDNGFEIVYDTEDLSAKIVVINTCGFIADAKEESIEMILNYVEAKNRGDIEQLFVMGCLSGRYKDELEKEIPEVDQFFGAKDFVEIIEALKATYNPALDDERYLTTPQHYAYLKISEGCDRNCSYCAIPKIRGRHISVPMEVLESEARKLAAKGVKELLVVAQDTTYYGIDLYGERRIAQLLRNLTKIEGIEWIRLHYAYPSQFPQDLIEVMRDEPKICKYLDIPFQHINENQLKSMRRATTTEQTEQLIADLRAAMPEIAIRTTLITGFCGESLDDFEELKDFVSRNKFERLGVFAYSPEDGTHSAINLVDDVPLEEKERRVEEIMNLQTDISFQNNQKMVGKTLKVIVDREEGEYFICRSQFDSVEVDQEILLETKNRVEIGEFYDVTVTESREFDLFATLN